MERVTITARMADGALIQERVRGFAAFVAVVLSFKSDPDCRSVVWYVEPPARARRLRVVRGGRAVA